MTRFEEIKKFLPQYLSGSQTTSLFNELKQFPYNIDSRIYSAILLEDELVYQGDGLQDLLLINLPDTDIREGRGMILSNTCDVDPLNLRFIPNRLIYAPILRLDKYKTLLDKLIVQGNKTIESIEDHINDIRSQRISNIFYLPKYDRLEYESIVFFDRINNSSMDFLRSADIPRRRLFALSDYGFYLFLFKLSIHFTRVQENVPRGLVDIYMYEFEFRLGSFFLYVCVNTLVCSFCSGWGLIYRMKLYSELIKRNKNGWHSCKYYPLYH